MGKIFFTKVTTFWFHHGNTIKEANKSILSKGWSLVDLETIEEIFKNHQRFLHRQDGILIATDPSCMEGYKEGEEHSAVVVPCIICSDAAGLEKERVKIEYGLIPDHSEIKVLAVR